jgi:hypothetical protein
MRWAVLLIRRIIRDKGKRHVPKALSAASAAQNYKNLEKRNGRGRGYARSHRKRIMCELILY